MDKYISQEELKNFFDKNIEAYEPCPDKYDTAVALKGASYSIPTSEVQPIVYGEWLRLGFHRQCSKCNNIFDLGTNYCPVCGANMKGEIKNEK